MVNVNDFDRKLIANEKYKSEILKAIGKAERFNLSNAFAKLIGYVGNKQPDVTPANLDGFFYWDIHGSRMKVEVKDAAIAKLNSLLAVADVNLNIESNNYQSKSERVVVRNTELRIGKENIESVFEKKITCKEGNCGKEWQITVDNQTKAKGESQWLHLPPVCIKGKLDIVLENIIRHSMCKHNGMIEESLEISLKGTSVGNKHRCLYLMIIAINKPNVCWKEEENGTLKKPTADEYVKNSASFLPYCDYVILVPKKGNSNYFLYNVASKYNGSAEDWREISGNGHALAEKVRFGSETLYIKHNDSKIQFHHTEGATKWERGSIEINKGMIVHVLVFNNYQK